MSNRRLRQDSLSELAEIKSVEHECHCVLYRIESHAIVTNDIIDELRTMKT